MQDEIKRRHRRDETEFWVTRPLDRLYLDYASFDVIQLRALYNFFRPFFHRCPHIASESKRYVELYRDYRRPVNQWYIEHGVLPQEILERSSTTKSINDGLGTRSCGACRRELHQDSFQATFANAWPNLLENGPLCHTCRTAKFFKDNPRPRRQR